MPYYSIVTNQREQWIRFLSELSPETDAETMHLMSQLRSVAHAMYRIGESSLDETKLSMAQYGLLMTLLFSERMEGKSAMNPSEISRRRGTNRNTISALVRTLEADGFIERELDQDDRRKFNIRLTDSGRNLVEEHAHGHFNTMNQVFASLTKAERAALGKILTKLDVK